MRLVVVSHKVGIIRAGCQAVETDGGFPAQMHAISEVFEETVICMPVLSERQIRGTMPLEYGRIRVTRLPCLPFSGWRRKAGLLLWLCPALPKLLKEIARADAVHCPIPGDVGTIGMLTAWLLRKPLFVRYCGNWQREGTLAERFCHWFMRRVAGGRNVMVATGAESGSNKDIGIEWVFSTSLKEAEMRRYGRPRSAPAPDGGRIVIVGRQTEGKGTGRLIRAMPLILSKRPKARLVVVGDGEDLAKFRALASAADVSGAVEFTGQLDHQAVMRELSGCDLFAFPTASEGFPKVAVEALACGLPLVCSGVSVLPLLVSGGAGRLFPDLEPESIAKTVLGALSRHEYERMSVKALETAARFTLEEWQGRIRSILWKHWYEFGFR